MSLHMDDNSAVVLVMAIFAIAGLIAFALYRLTGGD